MPLSNAATTPPETIAVARGDPLRDTLPVSAVTNAMVALIAIALLSNSLPDIGSARLASDSARAGA